MEHLKEILKLPDKGILLTLRNNSFSDVFSSLNIESIKAMDMYYIFNRSGNKIISSFLRNIKDDDNFMITLDYVTYVNYHRKWSKLMETFNLNYNPIKPYDMTVDMKVTDELTSRNVSSSNSTSKSETETSNNEISNSNEGVYGFNSTYSVDTDTSNGNSHADGSASSNDSLNSSGSTEYTRSNPKETVINRSGNIGNTTIQDLINKEREVQEWNIWETIFNDLDKLLVLSVYE